MNGTDLSADPTAERVSNVRGLQQPILPRNPLTGNGTTSSGATGGGGYSDRTYESRERQRQLHDIKNPPPDAYDIAVARYRARQAAEAAAEQNRVEQEKADTARTEARLKAVKERIENVKKFRAAEHLVDLALDGLMPDERGRVNQRLIAAGQIHNAELAAAFANEEIVSRDSRAPEPSNQFDWTAGIRRK